MQNMGLKHKAINIAAVCTAILTITAFTGCDIPQQGSALPGNTQGASVFPSQSIGQPAQVEIPSEVKSGTVEGSSDCVITLSDEGCTVQGTGASAWGKTVTVLNAGTYLVQGAVTDGQLAVDSADAEKVKLIFNGVFISCSDGAAVYIKNADKTVIELAPKSVNILSDGQTYSLDDGEDEPGACVFSKDDLKIKGAGELYVQGNYAKGIFSKDDLEIENAVIYVTAADDGIRGKDSVEINGGKIVVNADGDGIRTSNDVDEGKGNIIITDSEIAITSELDGIQSVSDLTVQSGSITVCSGGGSANSSSNNSSWGQWGDRGGGRPGANPPGDFGGMQPDSSADAETSSAKGIKAEGTLTVNGGSFVLDTSDDALHSNTVVINGGEYVIASGDDGMHADGSLTVNGGSIAISKSYEGLEAENLCIAGGTVSIVSGDDGINAAGGADASGIGRPGRGGFAGGGEQGSGSISISGGSITVNAEGDGLDSNGSITMTGGYCIVYGPTNSGNGALDYSGSFNISGGTLVALGARGMAQGISGGSQQAGLGVNINGAADKALKVTDEAGNVIIEVVSPKQYQSAVISSPDIISGQSYTFWMDGEKLGSVTA